MYICKQCGNATHDPIRIAGDWWCKVSHYRAYYRLNHTIHFGSTVSAAWPATWETDNGHALLRDDVGDLVRDADAPGEQSDDPPDGRRHDADSQHGAV